MSYRPPANKSNYGDDLTEDTWTQSTTPSATQPDYNLGNTSGGTLPLQSGSPSYSSNANSNIQSRLQQQPNQEGSLTNAALAAKSITQDDILFMRNWQRDSFFKRVIPFSVAGWGALFIYNKSKELPHKVSRYAIVGMAAFILGKYSYKDEFKRRLSENRSNTPYMQALRKALNIQMKVTEFGSDPNTDYNNLAVNDSSNWNNRDALSETYSSFGQEKRPTNEPNKSSFESENITGLSGVDGSTNRSTSYDELRARNRGYIK